MDPLGPALLNQVAADREGVLIIRLSLSSSHKLFQLSCLDLFQRLHCWDFSAWIHRYRDWVLVTKTSCWILLQSESWFSRPELLASVLVVLKALAIFKVLSNSANELGALHHYPEFQLEKRGHFLFYSWLGSNLQETGFSCLTSGIFFPPTLLLQF